MHKRIFIAGLALAATSAIANGQSEQQRRASMSLRPEGDRGKCTVEVVVDGAVEITVRGDTATMRNLAGQPPQWRRFECNAVMPRNPADFRFAGVDGRGRQELVRDPRDGGGVVVRIEDPQSGAEGYTFDLFWRNDGGGGVPLPQYDGRDRPDARDRPDGRDRPYDRDHPRNPRMSTDQAVRVCQDAVRQQASDRFRARDIDFRRIGLDDNPDRRDWVTGTFEIRRRDGRPDPYRFSCSVDFDRGVIRSVQIDPMDRDRR